ncbi:hypothetical protein HN51_006214 [Arachis hypogaea]
MIGSMVSSKLMAPHTWYFPSNFADEVLSGATVDRLQVGYTLPWMPETNNLHYVFVPIWEPADVWYLMMLDVKESRLYAFDVNKTPESIIRREANMTRICRMLGKLFMLNRNLQVFRLMLTGWALQFSVFIGSCTKVDSVRGYSIHWSIPILLG